MKILRPIRLTVGLALGIVLTACGGGSSSGGGSNPNPPPAPPPPSAATPVSAIGTITGFGSVYVSGIHYEVAADTVVAIEGETETMGDDSQLRLGMKVEVEADDDNGQRTARRIEFDEDIKGPIGSITPDAQDPTIGTFDIIGHRVTVDANTMFDDDIGKMNGSLQMLGRAFQVAIPSSEQRFGPRELHVLQIELSKRLDHIVAIVGLNPG